MNHRCVSLCLLVAVPLAAPSARAQGLSEVRAASSLVAALEDRATRSEAHASLVAMGAQAVPALVSRLALEPDTLGPDVAQPVLAVLEELGGRATVGLRTLEALRPVASYTWRADLDRTLLWVWPFDADFWNEPRDFEADYVDAHHATRLHPGYRAQILEGIHRLRRVRDLGIDPRDPRRMLRFLADGDPEIRAFAVAAFRSDPDVVREALPQLADAIRFPMPLAPMQRRFQESRAFVDLLIEAAPEEPIALDAYGYLMIYGESPEVRMRGIRGLAALGPAAHKLFRYMLVVLEYDDSRSVRLELIRAMGALGENGGEAAITLQHLTGHSDSRVRRAAEQSLRKIRAS